MADVFISYAREDQTFAGTLAHALESEGLSVWWDREIVTGHSFDAVIEHQLETARSVVVLWSPASVASDWVRSEASAAAEREVLVPVLVEPARLPLQFRRRQTADLKGWSGDPGHPGFRQVLTAIRLHCGERPPAVAPAAGVPRRKPARLGLLLAVPVAAGLAALAWNLRDAPPEQSRPGPTTSPRPHQYRWQMRVSNIDDDVYVDINSTRRFSKVGGSATFDLTPFLTGGDDRIFVRLGNGTCFKSSLDVQFLRDGQPAGEPARYEMWVSHCGWQLAWEWTVSKASGRIRRVQ